jgi:diacylglycerol kinase family enzyme
MDPALLVANPAASGFTGGLHRATVSALARRYRVEAAWPTSAGDARRLTAAAVAGGAALVVAMGGDGVVHHVAQELVGGEVPLGIVPVGTTNVLARLLGIPSRPPAAARLLTGRHSRTVRSPVLGYEAEGEAGRFTGAAVFALGVGADAAIVERAEGEPYRKYFFGGFHYARTAVATVWSDLRHRDPVIHVTAGGETAAGIGMLAQFQEVYTYFGRLPLHLARGRPDPLTVAVVERIPIRRAGAIALGAFRGRLGEVRGFRVWERVAEVRAIADQPVPAQADGELLGRVRRLTAEHRPEALPVIVPHSPRR